MKTLSDSTGTRGALPLTEADLAAARHDVPRRLGALPFPPGVASRSLWVLFLGEAGVWTHAVLPVDSRLDKPDPEHISQRSGRLRLQGGVRGGDGPGDRALAVLRDRAGGRAGVLPADGEPPPGRTLAGRYPDRTA
jgi:hypothetical protein